MTSNRRRRLRAAESQSAFSCLTPRARRTVNASRKSERPARTLAKLSAALVNVSIIINAVHRSPISVSAIAALRFHAYFL